jgi:hypothetical protein
LSNWFGLFLYVFLQACLAGGPSAMAGIGGVGEVLIVGSGLVCFCMFSCKHGASAMGGHLGWPLGVACF